MNCTISSTYPQRTGHNFLIINSAHISIHISAFVHMKIKFTKGQLYQILYVLSFIQRSAIHAWYSQSSVQSDIKDRPKIPQFPVSTCNIMFGSSFPLNNLERCDPHPYQLYDSDWAWLVCEEWQNKANHPTGTSIIVEQGPITMLLTTGPASLHFKCLAHLGGL